MFFEDFLLQDVTRVAYRVITEAAGLWNIGTRVPDYTAR
jgi:hypothetical protein